MLGAGAAVGIGTGGAGSGVATAAAALAAGGAVAEGAALRAIVAVATGDDVCAVAVADARAVGVRDVGGAVVSEAAGDAGAAHAVIAKTVATTPCHRLIRENSAPTRRSTLTRMMGQQSSESER